MQLFNCQCCGQTLYFENDRCTCCGHVQGFDPQSGHFQTLSLFDPGRMEGVSTCGQAFRFCANHATGGCNWLVSHTWSSFCMACRMNRRVPDLSDPEQQRLWQAVEEARRRLVYGLLKLKLPLQGLVFDVLAPMFGEQVRMGYLNGVVTLDLNEARSWQREWTREQMGESYRTLLGHLRHESGHHFWHVLVLQRGWADDMRMVFGDERQDYHQALQTYYHKGPSPHWSQRFVSAYASSHPAEDWAETWAHYLHILDTVDTAVAHGVRGVPAGFDAYRAADFDAVLGVFMPLSTAMNCLSRSMGHSDLYPFVLTPLVQEKLRRIHVVLTQGAVMTVC